MKYNFKSAKYENKYLSAYLKVFSVCSQDPSPGDIQEIITVFELPTKESRSTSVSLLPRNGIWVWSLSKARMHSFKAKRLLLISAPSILWKGYKKIAD